MSRIHGMRPLISAILRSIKPLLNVLALFCFMVFLQGIVGVEMLSGKLRNRCVYSEGPNAGLQSEPTNTTLFGRELLCDSSDGRQCPAINGTQTRCAAGFANPDTFNQCISFDNFPSAVLAIFQSITTEGWTDIMYAVEEVWGTWSARIYFFTLILCGSWFVINLALAVISDAFTSATAEEGALTERELRHKQALIHGAQANFLENGGQIPTILQAKRSAARQAPHSSV
jgi:hypothetical protein